MLAFKPERRPQADIWGARVWVLAERGGMWVSGCAVPPPNEQAPEGSFPSKSHPCAPEEEGTPQEGKGAPTSASAQGFSWGEWRKKKKNIFLPPDLFQQMGRVARSRVAFFGGGFAYIPDFGGRLGQARCSAGYWLPAKGEDEVWGRRRRGPERGASDFDINYRKPSSSACKTLSCGLNPKGTGLPPHAPKGGCLTSAGAGCP